MSPAEALGRDEAVDAVADFVANRAHAFERLVRGILERPVLAPRARHDGAGFTAAHRNQPVDAIGPAREAVAIYRKRSTGYPMHERYHALMVLEMIGQDAAQLQEVAEWYREFVADLRRTLGPDDPFLARVLLGFAFLYMKQETVQAAAQAEPLPSADQAAGPKPATDRLEHVSGAPAAPRVAADSGMTLERANQPTNPEAEDELLVPRVWEPALQKYAAVTRLTVALYNARRELEGADWDVALTASFGPNNEQVTLRAGDVLVSWVAHDHLHLRQFNELLFAWNQHQAQPYQVDYAGGW